MLRSVLGLTAAIVVFIGGDVWALRPSAGCERGSFDTGRRIERLITVAEQRREFIIDAPANLEPAKPVPLLFHFHGFGHSGAGMWKVSEFKALSERHGFITVYPTGLRITLELKGKNHVGLGWQMEAGGDNRDLAFTRAMLAEIESMYCVDLDRVFATGFSNGGFFASLLGCEMSDRIAAVAPVSGGALRGNCRPARPVPVMIHHGVRDEVIEVDWARASRDQWLEANGCKTSPTDSLQASPACKIYQECTGKSVVIYCEENYAHRWPAQASERIWRFFAER